MPSVTNMEQPQLRSILGAAHPRGRWLSRSIALLMAAFLTACAAGQQSTYKLSLSEPHLPVLCRVYLDSQLKNIVDVKTTAGDCINVTNRLQAWSMEAFVEREGKLIPAAQYLEKARRDGRQALVHAATASRLVSVYGRFITEGEWEGETWEERALPQFVNLDSGLRISPTYGVFATGPGSASRSGDGWYRIRLYPGSYVMGLAPRFDKPARPFRFDVPPDTENIYIGSFRFKCTGRERGLGVYPLTCSDNISVTQERDVAARRMDVGAASLALAPTLPYPSTWGQGATSLPERINLQKRWRLEVPDWSRFTVTEDYEEKLPTAGDIPAGLAVGALQGLAEGLLVQSGAIVPLAALAMATGRNTLNQWTPCVSKMDAAIRETDLAATFRRRLRAHTRSPGNDLSGTGWLNAEIHRIIIRKCTQPKTYCIEVSIRTRLIVGDEAVYDRVHVYSGREGKLGHLRWPGYHYWETPVEPASTCREIGQYCEAEGQKRAIREVETALDAIAAAVVRDLTNQ